MCMKDYIKAQPRGGFVMVIKSKKTLRTLFGAKRFF